MNEQNINEVSNDGTVDNIETKKETNIDNAETNNSKQVDVTKVKIRTILKQRFKKSNSILKMVIALILVAILCFGAGLIAGRELDRHGNGRIFMNRNNMYRQMPKGYFNGGNSNRRQFNNKNSQNQNNSTPKATPPANNSQPQ